VGTGTITFRFGTYDGTFTANPAKAIESVTIDATNNSLQGIRDAVNAADAGVTASIVNDGSGYRLLFKSDDSGEDNSLEVTVTDTGDGNNLDNAGLSQLAYDPTGTLGNGKNMTETSEAQDAAFSIDGLSMTRSSNTVTGAIEGVTLELTGETSGTPETLTLAQDLTDVTTKVQAFVDSYNTLNSTLDDLAGYDTSTEEGGILLGDSMVNSVTSSIRNILTGAISGLSGSYTSLAQVGISFQLDGTLELDTSDLNDALEDDVDAVAKVFAATGTPSDSLISYVSSTDDTVVGDYAVTVTQLATQGVFTGGAAALTVDATNDTFELDVDGVSSGTITLTQGVYASGDDLAAQIQSQINGDDDLQSSGVSVVVSYDVDHFVITSASYGDASKVELTTVEGTGLGLDTGSDVDGVNVAGTIGGVAATGIGQSLYGSGDTDGLKITVAGGALGSRGTLSFTRGVASQLDILIDSYTATGSLIDIRSDGLNDRLDYLDEQRERLDRRIAAIESRYQTQFAALDIMLSQLQATSSYLTQQLASLPGAYSSSSD
jgi:flagellar hook-associated protein 2